MANGSRKRWRKKRRLDAARALAAGSGPAFGGAPGGGGPSQDEEEELEEGELRELPTPPDDVLPDEEAPPAFDPAVEALVGPLTPLSLLKIIDDLPPPSFGFSERSRIRTRAILRGLAFLDIGVTIDAYVYIRPEVISSDDEGFELPNDGCRFVVTLYNGELLYFLVCTNISWMRTSSAESMGLHTELVEMMEWQMCYMPELIRKAAIHLGMPASGGSPEQPLHAGHGLAAAVVVDDDDKIPPLPADIVLIVGEWLSLHDVRRMMGTCRAWDAALLRRHQLLVWWHDIMVRAALRAALEPTRTYLLAAPRHAWHRSCDWCGEAPPANDRHLCCARRHCRASYCSKACQKRAWHTGHSATCPTPRIPPLAPPEEID